MKDYIMRQARLAQSNYRIARSGEERETALREMHRLTLLASEMYGFEFADNLPWRRDE